MLFFTHSICTQNVHMLTNSPPQCLYLLLRPFNAPYDITPPTYQLTQPHHPPNTTKDAVHAAFSAVACIVKIHQSRREPQLLHVRDRRAQIARDRPPTAASFALFRLVHEPPETITLHHQPAHTHRDRTLINPVDRLRYT
jgi:hypothetical protein